MTSENQIDGHASPPGSIQASVDPRSYSNPPFDPRIRSLPYAEGGYALRRGVIIQAPEYFKAPKKAKKFATGQQKPFSLNFLYNPSDITVAYSVNTNALPSNMQSSPAILLMSDLQVVTFSLFFDRTYEVATLASPHPKMKGVKDLIAPGVYADIAALERVCGIVHGEGGLRRVPCNLYFGSTTDTGAGGRPLAFYGYVNNMTVQYTHFSRNMTPMRAVTTVDFNQLANSPDGRPMDPEDVRAMQDATTATARDAVTTATQAYNAKGFQGPALP